MEELNELRKIAESATPGNWMWVNDRTPELIRAGKFPYTHVTYTEDVVDENALYIATFDPPTVLALLSRLEQAEQAVARVREALSGHPCTCDRHTEDDPVKCGWKRAVIDVQRALNGDGRG